MAEPGAQKAFKAARTWLWDKAIEHWLTILISSGVGGLAMGYLASISSWLDKYGPIAWGAIGLATWFFILFISAFTYWLYALARMRSQQATFAAMQSKTTDYINPLEDTFHKRRIKIQDLIDPYSHDIKNKTFTDCELVGPANLVFNKNCHFSGVNFAVCNLVLVNKNFIPYSVTMVNDLHMTRGKVIGATLFCYPPVKAAMGNLAVDLKASWVNE